MYLLSGCSSSWWYPNVRLSLENTVAMFSSCMTSSIVWVMWHSHWMAVLDCRMSTQTLTLSGSFGFGGVTMGETYGVGPVAISIMSSPSSLFGSFSTFCRMWNGTRLWGKQMGWMSVLMWSLTWTFFFYLPMPWNRSGWLSTNSSADICLLEEDTQLIMWPSSLVVL